MEDFSEVTDLETARHVLIGYDKAFREHAEIHTQMKAEIERLRRDVEEANARAYIMAKEVTLWQSRDALK